jgi:hypothetical protein
LVSRLGAQTTHLNGLGVEEILAVGSLILSRRADVVAFLGAGAGTKTRRSDGSSEARSKAVKLNASRSMTASPSSPWRPYAERAERIRPRGAGHGAMWRQAVRTARALRRRAAAEKVASRGRRASPNKQTTHVSNIQITKKDHHHTSSMFKNWHSGIR